jgi:hypothetical protein
MVESYLIYFGGTILMKPDLQDKSFTYSFELEHHAIQLYQSRLYTSRNCRHAAHSE